MRQIKFRGFSKKKNKWVYGYYAIIHIADNDHGKFNGLKPIPSIFNDEDDRSGGYWTEVDPDTVGQFTGLQDKFGRDIYEGDLVRHDEKPDELFEIVYDAPEFCYKGNEFGFHFMNHPELLTVIGSIRREKGGAL